MQTEQQRRYEAEREGLGIYLAKESGRTDGLFQNNQVNQTIVDEVMTEFSSKVGVLELGSVLESLVKMEVAILDAEETARTTRNKDNVHNVLYGSVKSASKEVYTNIGSIPKEHAAEINSLRMYTAGKFVEGIRRSSTILDEIGEGIQIK
jgi:hypothetical protein